MKNFLKKTANLATFTLGSLITSGLFLPALSLEIGNLTTSTLLCGSQMILGTGSCENDEFVFSNFTNITGSWTNSTIQLTTGFNGILIPVATASGTLNYTVTAPQGQIFTSLGVDLKDVLDSGSLFTTNYTTTSQSQTRDFDNSGIASIAPTSSVNSLNVGIVWTASGGDQSELTNFYAAAVPWETDVLPLVVATALFTGAVWWKRRRGAEQMTDDRYQMTDISEGDRR